MGEIIRMVVDGVEYELERDEALEAEIEPVVKEMLAAATEYIVVIDDTPRSLVDMGATHTTMPVIIACPRCGSEDTMKYGIEYGTQQYICKGCRRKFNAKQTPFKMRFPAAQIGAALAMFYDGLSCADISRQIAQNSGVSVNPSSVYRWVQRYTQEAVRLTEGYKANTGRVWAADETVLGVRVSQGIKEGLENTVWYWDVIDESSRFLLASHFSRTRTIKDAETLFGRARNRATNVPEVIVTDRLKAYLDGIERVFGGDLRHIQSQGMRTETHNNVIERFHGTIKERTKVMRDLKSPESAALIMAGWAVHYNFFRPHMSLKGKTPEEAAGIKYEAKNWTDVVQAVGA